MSIYHFTINRIEARVYFIIVWNDSKTNFKSKKLISSNYTAFIMAYSLKEYSPKEYSLNYMLAGFRKTKMLPTKRIEMNFFSHRIQSPINRCLGRRKSHKGNNISSQCDKSAKYDSILMVRECI